MATMQDVLKSLGISEYELSRICGEFNVRELSVIGNASRTNEDGETVVDLLVDLGSAPAPGVPLLARMRASLEAVIGSQVNLMPRASLALGERQRVLAAAFPIYPAARDGARPLTPPVERRPAARASTAPKSAPRATPPPAARPAGADRPAKPAHREPWVHPLHRGKNGHIG
jgi:predicted nucleotidyltransferase